MCKRTVIDKKSQNQHKTNNIIVKFTAKIHKNLFLYYKNRSIYKKKINKTLTKILPSTLIRSIVK